MIIKCIRFAKQRKKKDYWFFIVVNLCFVFESSSGKCVIIVGECTQLAVLLKNHKFSYLYPIVKCLVKFLFGYLVELWKTDILYL